MTIGQFESVDTKPHDSGEYESGRFAIEGRPSVALEAALHYWPDRWSRGAVLAAIAITSVAADMTSKQWVVVLDGLAALLAPSLRDASTFPSGT